MAAYASPVSQDGLCHTVYGVTAVQAGTTPPRSVVSGAGATFSNVPSGSSSSQIVPGLPLPSLTSTTPTTSWVHTGKRLELAASIGVNSLHECVADVELRQDDMFTGQPLHSVYGNTATNTSYAHRMHPFVLLIAAYSFLFLDKVYQ